MAATDDSWNVFVQEARGYLQRLRRLGEVAGERRALSQSLAEIAATIGAGTVRALAERIGTTEGDDPVRRAGLLLEVEAALADLPRDGGDREASSELTEDGWDVGTTRVLRQLFADEAREHLEVMNRAAMLLGSDPAAMEEILRRAHTLKGAASTVGLAAVGQAAHLLEERCVALTGDEGSEGEALVDWMLDALDLLQQLLERDEAGAGQALDRLRQALDLRGGPALAEAGSARAGREARVRALARAESDRRAGVERRRVERRGPASGGASIRVDVHHVEELMNAGGQLVIDRTRVERHVEALKGVARDLSLSHEALRGSLADLGSGGELAAALERVGEVEVELADALANFGRSIEGLVEDSDRLGRTARVLREQLTRVRLMPIAWMYARLQRTIRELSRAEGKRVKLVTEGESTEIDRSVAERISDPLIHLVRNAIAHGIEAPHARRELGKPDVGVIRVTARHQGDMLFLEVEDDGAGLDPRLLREAAGRLGFGAQSDETVEPDAISLIFSSGFSTRAVADGLAGRGVGLDVVRQNIASLSGEVRVSSRPGTGTRFSIRLPMTTAVTQALLFKEAGQVYAIPVLYVAAVHVVEPAAVSPPRNGDGWRLRLRGTALALLRLEDLLGSEVGGRSAGACASNKVTVIEIAFAGQRFALSCTGRLVGPREIVLRRLGPLLGAIPLYAGATISGSGKVQLVLDVATLAEIARQGAHTRAPAGRVPARPAGRVLVVDDSRSIREMLGLILGDVGYVVDVAADGWEAWQRLRDAPGYDLLVTDLEMPRVDGYELIARCRAGSGELADLPILVLTSRTAPANLERARAAGADRFVKKPLNRRVILDAVRSLHRARVDEG